MMARKRSFTQIGLGTLAVGWALSSPAFASGMPQLDFKNPLVTGQVIWGAVIFFIFYMILSRSMLPRIGKIIRDRTAYITSEAEKARNAKSAADRAFSEQQAALENARKTAQAHMQQLLEREHQESIRVKEGATGRIKKEIAEAEERIAQEKAQALLEMHEVAADVTEQIVFHFTGARCSRELVDSKIKAFVK